MKIRIILKAAATTIIGAFIAVSTFIGMPLLIYVLYGGEIYARWGKLGFAMETILGIVWWIPIMLVEAAVVIKIGNKLDQQLEEERA